MSAKKGTLKNKAVVEMGVVVLRLVDVDPMGKL
jgi:hypothetical protein